MPTSGANAREKLRGLMQARGRQRLHRESAGGVRAHPLLHLAQRLALGGLRGQRRAELRLPAGALHEHHQPARHLERRLGAEVVLHQRQRQVDARRSRRPRSTRRRRARRCCRARPRHRWVALAEPVDRRPVGRDPAAVEQSRPGQQEGAGAHRGHAPGAPGGVARPSARAPRRAAAALHAAARRPPRACRSARGHAAGGAVEASRVRPLLVAKRPAAGGHDLRRSSCRGPVARPRANTSSGPTKSSDCAPSKATSTMRRGVVMARSCTLRRLAAMTLTGQIRPNGLLSPGRCTAWPASSHA